MKHFSTTPSGRESSRT